MKTGKIIIGVLSIIIGIVALIESNDVYRLASSFGVNGFHVYVGFIVGFIFICLGILSLVLMNEQSKKYADIAMPISSIAIFLCFRGPEIFTDLVFFAVWGAICLIFAIITFYGTKNKDEDENINQLISQSTCPYCHADVDESSMFCGSCGKKIKTNCPHCGAAIIEGDIFCKNCGQKVDEAPSLATPFSAVTETVQQRCPHCNTPYNDGSVFCENCGKKINDEPSNASIQQQPQPSTRNGNLVIRWDGAWVLIDYKIKMNVNGNNIGEYSFKDGFETSVPITSSDMTVVTKLSFCKTKVNLALNPNENYTYELVYHRMSGWLGFILYDSQGNELRRDKLHWGMFLLSFLLPIVGIIYAICVWKKKPATAHSAIYASILGFIVSFIVSFNLPTLSKFAEFHNSQAIVATDTIAEVVDSIDINEEISDVHSEAFIKKRMEEICKAIYSIDEEKVVDKYFSTEFKKLYNTITTLEKSGKGGDGLWYSGGFFDGSSEEVDSMSAGKIYSIEDNMAKADFIYYNGNHKYTQLARLVLEDGNWFVDDICDRMSDMSEYIEYMMNNDNNDEIKSQEELARENTAIGAFTIDEDSIR